MDLLLTVANLVSQAVCAPFIFIGEIARQQAQNIPPMKTARNIFWQPIIFLSKVVSTIMRVALIPISLIPDALGLILWHSGESIVNLANKSSISVLNNSSAIRSELVYTPLGMTALAAVAVFIPIPAIQLIALPIVFGSIYGIINNQFTIRECPEYYTIDHSYRGQALDMHAIKTNNHIIKPIITGCYATTLVTSIAGVVLSMVGVLPYATLTLPVSIAATAIGAACLIGLVTGHIFANMAKSYTRKTLDEYGKHIGLEWSKANREATFNKLQLKAFEQV
jgi:hypothetical protein